MEEEPKPSEDPLADAMAGNVEALNALDAVLAYKWLLVAHNCGHEDALDYIDDLEEHNEARFDEDGYTIMGIHLKLAASYLQGQEGLSIDLVLARHHLLKFLEGPHRDLGAICSEYLDELMADLQPEAKALVQSCIVGHSFHTAKRRIDRVQRLHDLNLQGANVPQVIMKNEIKLLQEQVDALIARALDSQ